MYTYNYNYNIYNYIYASKEKDQHIKLPFEVYPWALKFAAAST